MGAKKFQPKPKNIVDEALYRKIRKDARRARVYGDMADDVAHEAWLIARMRGYYDHRMIREAARNLGLWRVKPHHQDQDDQAEVRREQRERIFEALVYASPRVQEAACLIIAGYTLSEAAQKVGMSTSALFSALREAGRRALSGSPLQMPLFARRKEVMR